MNSIINRAVPEKVIADIANWPQSENGDIRRRIKMFGPRSNSLSQSARQPPSENVRFLSTLRSYSTSNSVNPFFHH